MPLITRFAAGFDRAVLRGATLFAPSSRADALDVAERLARLESLASEYGRRQWIDDPDSFFGPARTVEPARQPRRRQFGREVVDLTWDSAYEPVNEELAPRYLAFEHNRVATARWFRSPSPRPTLIAIHGYGGGSMLRESRYFPVRYWARAGMDVVLFALPFHGPRRAPGDKIRFPSGLPPVTIEGFRQAVHDLRGLVGFLQDAGAPAVGVVGMSLGGYTTALLATVEPRLSFAAPMIPLASLADYAMDRGRYLGTAEEQQAQRDGVAAVYRVISPLARPSQVPAERMLILAGEGDRITPIRHAERLAKHFGCELERFAGGHILQLGRRRAFAVLQERLSAAW